MNDCPKCMIRREHCKAAARIAARHRSPEHYRKMGLAAAAARAKRKAQEHKHWREIALTSEA